MPDLLDPHFLRRLDAAYEQARGDLLAARDRNGHWVGELSSSALSTATAISALSTVLRENTAVEFSIPNIRQRIDDGIDWLAGQANSDGGFGDTDKSYSNIATTMLVRAAVCLAGKQDAHRELLQRAEQYIENKGGLSGLRARYGKDKTFAIPILTNAAIAGLVPWEEVSPLPFELACLPQSWYRFARMPVVSYAIPALVAVGQVRYAKAPPANPLLRQLRKWSVEPGLRVLSDMQPASGGYLEAVPLTSFVVMSLAHSGRSAHRVVDQGLEFLMESVRPDGSWPIDTNLATWNTSLSLNALAGGGEDLHRLGPPLLDWLLDCQFKTRHPFTGAAPGGWGWSDLSGAVPDADDTPGSILALCAWHQSPHCDGASRSRIEAAIDAGVGWLVDLQNRDGGWPTFCRGWGKLPFDRSGADLTAHVLRAFVAWRQLRDSSAGIRSLVMRTTRATRAGLRYLERVQDPDGSWLPLWFGNQDRAAEDNPVYGTSKVLLAYAALEFARSPEAVKAQGWLISHQNQDGGWGTAALADRGPIASRSENPCALDSSVEETALAVEALSAADPTIEVAASWRKGLDWLLGSVETKRHLAASPIGFYFAKLWYYERLYPLEFTVAALGRARKVAQRLSAD